MNAPEPKEPANPHPGIDHPYTAPPPVEDLPDELLTEEE